MQFLTLKDLQLNAAGYLVSKTDKKPVTHSAFVAQQSAADYIVRLSQAIEGKTFKAAKVDNLEAIKASVRAAMADTNHKYVATPSKPTSKVNDELVRFALEFDAYNDKKGQVDTINNFMQQFNTINDVQTVGEYFSEGVVKTTLHDIPTILAAVTACVELLGDL